MPERFFIDTTLLSDVSIQRKNAPSESYSFEMGKYIGQKSFFNELSRIQDAITHDQPLEIFTGEKIAFNSLSGSLAGTLYLQEVESAQSAFVGIAQKGLDMEIQVLTSRPT